MTEDRLVLVMEPPAGATVRYRRFVADLLDDWPPLLPFPVWTLETQGDADAWARYFSELLENFRSVLLVGPDAAAGRDLPLSRIPGVSYRNVADDLDELIDLLHPAPSRGRRSPSAPLSVSGTGDFPQKGGRLTVPPGEVVRSDPEPEGASALDQVHAGASVPPRVRPGRPFTARFATYTDAHRGHVEKTLQDESPRSKTLLDLDKCLWRAGARVTVGLSADDCEIDPAVQTFEWDGAWKILRFDVSPAKDYDDDYLTLRFDVLVEGLPVMRLRPEIDVVEAPGAGKTADAPPPFTGQPMPTSAFASYSVKDRQVVLERVRSLQIYTGMDVFLDRTHLVPGDDWATILERELLQRDVFWLFWSRNASRSKWVDWEWRLALREKTIDSIQPHPLEPMELAPAPEELSALQFGTMYESYLTHLREHPRGITPE